MLKDRKQKTVGDKSNRLRRVVLYICTIIYMAAIFYFSSQNQVASTELSDKVVKPVMNVVEQTQIVDRKFDIFDYFNFSERIRDVMHFLEYAVLGVLTWLSVETFNMKQKRLVTILFCILYACSDEIHQIFVQGRGASIYDVIIDACGSLIGLGICLLIRKQKGKLIIDSNFAPC